MNKADIIRQLFIVDGLSIKKIHEKTSFSLSYVNVIVSDINNGGGDTCRLRMDNKKYRLNNKQQRNKDRKANYAKGRLNAIKSGQPYSKEELRLIKGGFDGNDRNLAKIIGRSVLAIQVQRARMK